MAIFRSYNDLVLSFIEYLRLVQPELDTKPGTVARDVFVDNPSQQMSELYSQLRNISGLQSLFSVSGTDLNRLASNYGLTRKSGQVATGVAVLTTNNVDTDLLIPINSYVLANNGITYKTTENYIMYSASSNVYRATATRLRSELDLASITDEFAIEVNVEALTTGTSGNIGTYSITSHNIGGISNATNLQNFSGGSNPESDDSFKVRVLSVFAGSNTGTALGYLTAVDAISGVSDSTIIVPGNPLLIRDGTQVTTNSSGELVVSEPGSGGKVDIYVLGSSLSSQIDSFIYNDQSGKNDPTDTSNDVVLGQRGQDSTLSISQRRVTLIANNTLPYQPVDGILTVAGSSSGPNFVEKYTDSDGRVRGNFELIKDTGDYSGSPFGFDKLRWTADEIELEDEEVVKGTFNGIDEVDFTDIQRIKSISQDFLVTNENSTTSSSNRSLVQLKHTPVRSVSRVVNLTTGERYIISNQNPNGTAGEINTDGQITISGNTLPVSTDVLQVDYIWIKPFDDVFDFDNLYDRNVNRQAQDSVDWGFGNLVANEPATVEDDGYGVLTVTVTHPIYKVVSVNIYETDVSTVDSGSISANNSVTNVLDVRRVEDDAELFNTDAFDGTLTGTSTILLPSDSLGSDGDLVTLRFNYSDIYAPDGYDPGTFVSNVITLPEGISSDSIQVLVNYVADVEYLLEETDMTYLPITGRDNGFVVNNVETGDQPISHITDSNDNITTNLRRAGSNLKMSVNSIVSGGSLTVLGTSVKKVTDALLVVTAGSGYTVDLRQAIMSDLGVSSLPSTVQISKLYSIERVDLDSSNQVESVDNVYDVVNYKINDNSYDLEIALKDETLNSTQIKLAPTADNTSAMFNTGDIVRVTFHYIDTSASELVYFSKSGEQVSDTKFINVRRIYVNHGFKDPAQNVTGNLKIKNYNQPANNATYGVSYNYTAPKENERITVTFNYNQLINTVTTTIEDVRPITADVLIKSAVKKTIDTSIRIVLLPEYSTQSQTVIQDATDAVSTYLTASSMGTTIDSSDLVNTLYSVNGIDRVRVLTFSYGSSGNVLSITADENEYLASGTVDIQVEER